MTFENAFNITTHLAAFALFLQSFEMYFIARQPGFQHVWHQNAFRAELQPRFLFSNSAFRILVLIQILAAIGAFFIPHIAFFTILFLIQLLICIRFRGTFNGGSDMMTFVILTGILISLVSNQQNFQKLGLFYIAIHLIYSYVKAGLVKIFQKEWRNGSALPAFFQISLYPDVRRLGHQLRRQKWLFISASWSVITFEIFSALLFFFPSGLWVYFLAAIVFHFLIYVAFGLNRFFWIWLTAWPSVFYALHFRL